MKYTFITLLSILLATGFCCCHAQTNQTGAIPHAAAAQESWAATSNRWSSLPLPQVKKSAEAGNASAQFFLGFIYWGGYGVKTNMPESYKWLRLAALQGIVIAQRSVGVLLQEGRGVEKNYSQALEWTHKAAEAGDAAAQYNWGYQYAQGPVDERNYPEAEKWMRLAAEQGGAEEQYLYGMILNQEVDKTGRWVPNIPVAAEWITKAAKQDYADAQYELADMYNGGALGDDQRTNCIPWFLKAAANGNKNAQAELGTLLVLYPNSELLKSLNPVPYIRQSAEHGEIRAQMELSYRYQVGEGVTKDPIEAFKWMQKAASQETLEISLSGNSRAFLGRMYDKGEGVTQDLEKARTLYEDGLAHGCNIPEMHYRCGQMFEKGEGGPQDDLQATEIYSSIIATIGLGQIQTSAGIKRFEMNSSAPLTIAFEEFGNQAAERLLKLYLQGRGLPVDNAALMPQIDHLKNSVSTPSLFYLVGEVYHQGKLTARDDALAAELYNKAATLGSLEAMNRIGEMWVSGINGAPDPTESVKWYRKASLKGFAPAQMNLGVALQNGQGVEQNLVEAWAYLKLAADQNVNNANRALDQLSAQLTADQRTKALDRAQSLAKNIASQK